MKKWADGRFVLTVMIVAIIIKLIIAIAYYNLWLLPGHKDLIGPDGEGFIQRGWYIAKVLSNKADYQAPSNEFVFQGFDRVVYCYKGKLPPFNSRANGLLTYCIGFIFFLFGYVPLLIKGLNILISAISSVLTYLLALEIYGNKAARKAMALFTFFPTIFIFSLSALRDPLIILCVLSAIYALVKLNKKPDLGSLVLLGGALLLVLFLREELFVIMSLIAFITFVLNKALRFKIAIILPIILLLLSAANNKDIFYKIRFKPEFTAGNAGAVIFMKNAALYSTGGRLAYKTFQDKHYDMYKKYSSESDYLKSPGKITTLEVVMTLPKAVFFYFTRPFPFVHSGPAYALISFCVISWYLVLILAVSGVINTRLSLAYPIFMYILAIVLITSMFETNGGILIRHRDLIAPMFLLFASAAGGVTRKG